MAVTKQTYTATSTWTASQLAGIFRSAFIDAGIMTEWHDSFLSGTVENRVLQVVNHPTKTYGTVFYWFMFTTTGVFLNTSLGWNTSTDVPSGTQYLDYYSLTTNATTFHRTLVTLAAATTCTITRYTSAVNTDCTWFLLRNGTTNATFMIPKGNYNVTSFVDQDKMAYNGIIESSGTSSNNVTYMDFSHISGNLRRTYLGSTCLRGITNSGGVTLEPVLSRYIAYGNVNNSTSNYSSSLEGVVLPTAFTNTNPDIGTNHNPIFTSISPSPYLPALPSDFGIASYYLSNAMVASDTLVVSAGTEEWEMLKVANNAINIDSAKTLFLARVI